MFFSVEPFSGVKWMMLLTEKAEVIHSVLPDNIQKFLKVIKSNLY